MPPSDEKMLADDLSTLAFVAKSSSPFKGLAVIFDLAGFSTFFNEAGDQEYVPTFLNEVLNTVRIAIGGGEPYWYESKIPARALEPPVHVKFLGDGALYVWKLPEDSAEAERLRIYLCNRLFNIHNNFEKILDHIAEEVPVVGLPPSIRFGVASGVLYELTREDGASEFIGFPINLASRLQSYCRGLGFIVSAHLGFTTDQLKQFGYSRVVATNVPGFPPQLVLVDENEYKKLDKEVKANLFREKR